MIVFKTFLKVLKKCKMPVIIYTALLILFTSLIISSCDNQINFVASKPAVLIINNDENKGLTKNLVKYIEDNSELVKVENNEEAISDALFYRDVNYIIYIPKNFRTDFLNKKNPTIEIKSTGDYQASLSEIMLNRYLKFAKVYLEANFTETQIIANLDNTLKKEATVVLDSRLDTNNLARVTFFYNFTTYSILAGVIYVICLVLASFKKDTINKRTIISNMNYRKYNQKLLLSNGLFAIIFWIFQIILSFMMLGDIMLSWHGLVYIINAFVFMFCALTIAFLIGTLVRNKEAINGIVNVIALGSSFLCGAFVPIQFMPDYVLNIAHILPAYWYIKTNELIKSIEIFDAEIIKQLVINMSFVLLFSLIFIILTNIISSKKRKFN